MTTMEQSRALTALYQKAAQTAADEVAADVRHHSSTAHRVYRECLTDLAALGHTSVFRERFTPRRQKGIIVLSAYISRCAGGTVGTHVAPVDEPFSNIPTERAHTIFKNMFGGRDLSDA